MSYSVIPGKYRHMVEFHSGRRFMVTAEDFDDAIERAVCMHNAGASPEQMMHADDVCHCENMGVACYGDEDYEWEAGETCCENEDSGGV